MIGLISRLINKIYIGRPSPIGYCKWCRQDIVNEACISDHVYFRCEGYKAMNYQAITQEGKRLTREIRDAESREDQKLVNSLLTKKNQLLKIQARYVRIDAGKNTAA